MEKPRFSLMTLIAATLTAGLFVAAMTGLSFWPWPVAGDRGMPGACFMIGTLALAIQVERYCRSLEKFLVLWMFVSAPLGWFGCYILFGNKPTFHGEGVPIPLVIFEGQVDYPNPAALVENPVAIWGIGIALVAVTKGWVWLGKNVYRRWKGLA